MEIVIGGVVLLVVLGILSGPILGLVALLNTASLRRRIDALEKGHRGASEDASELAAAQSESQSAQPEESQAEDSRTEVEDAERAARHREDAARTFHWETFLGRKALGWVPVVLLLFGVAFFMRYAFENDWIGPMGQVWLGVIAGAGLAMFGWWCKQLRGWMLFSQIATSAGLLLLYLSTFAAFGYYTILSQQVGSLFLLLIVAAGALLAVVSNVRITPFTSRPPSRLPSGCPGWCTACWPLPCWSWRG